MENNLSYSDVCRIVGKLYIDYQLEVASLNKENIKLLETLTQNQKREAEKENGNKTG